MDESGSRFTKIRPRLEEEDLISNMPDHILVSILNLMTTEEGKKGEIEQVVRTSVLSQRWRFLWNYSLKSLTFTLSERNSGCDVEDESFCDAAHREFVDRVNLILALPVVGNTIDDFNLTLWVAECQSYWSDHLPGWIGFALQKRVKRLTINIPGYGDCFSLDDNIIRNHNMDSLVSLCLLAVDVTGELLEHLLTICRSLEHMSISWSMTLVDFTVSGPCLKLKYLEIHDCLDLGRVYIRSVNLVSFDYDNCLYENDADVVIEDAPRLVKACLNCMDETAKVLSYLPHLQSLVLAFDSNWFLGSPLVLPKLMNLVRVELKLIGRVFGSTICASVLVSCPSMSELVLKFLYLKDFYEDNKVERLEHPHKCLKVVELVGFIGCKLDIGVALYLIENTLSLQTILVDTRLPYRSSDEVDDEEESDDDDEESDEVVDEESDEVVDEQSREIARARAKEHLGSRLLHTSTKLVLI